MTLPKMVADEDTAYDEIIGDIEQIGVDYITSSKARRRLREKIAQLRRLLGEEE